ncbi:MAG: class I tRNA ligase family protein [bacterium]
MLQPVPQKLDLVKGEKEILDFWERRKIFERSIDEREGRPDYVFYDGPPGTNGKPHIGHMMQSALKDLWPRYKTMAGYRVLRKAGWDTHGLPIELTAERELGLKSKREIESYGVQKYIDYCRSTVFRYKKTWEDAIWRIGRFLDLENAYATYETYYIQSDWWTLKQAWNLELEGDEREAAMKRGQSPRYLYRDYRVLPYCARCGTSLSSFEVAQGYEEITELSLFLKFKVRWAENTFFTAWTTTAWTLLSNIALAVGPDVEYATVRVTEAGPATKVGERLVVAKVRLELLRPLLGEFEIVETKMGREIEGLAYEPLFDFLAQPGETAHRVFADDYVTTEEGTGIVHLAAYGEDDFRIIRQKALPLVQNVNVDGLVSAHCGRFAGRYFKDPKLEEDILSDLAERGLLLGREDYTHTYPFCYRCDAPLMYFPRPSWFIRTSALRPMMLKANSLIGWQPEHIRDGRFGNWLEGAIDWNITRERYWGSPLPIWSCTEAGCDHQVCVGTLRELDELVRASDQSGLPEDFDPHKPAIDEIVLRCPKGHAMRRENFVLDSWFNAGLMPWGQFGYPAQHDSDKLFEIQYPCDFICEAIDQTRGWFYTLLACSCLIAAAQAKECRKRGDEARARFWEDPRNWSSYRNCICTELVLDPEGFKMSKSRGNVLDPMQLFEAHGADPVRWVFYASNPWTTKRFSETEIGEHIRTVFLPLWNAYSFFVTYARIDGWKPVKGELAPSASLMDRWIVSEYQRLVGEVIAALDNYDVATAAESITHFLDLLTNWYIRRSRRRFWKSENDADKAVAYETLYAVMKGLTSLLAPFLPFLTERIYRNLVRGLDETAPESVHLCAYPVPDNKLRDAELEERMEQVMRAASLARAIRQEHNLKVRQPLAALHWVVPVAGMNEEGLAPFLQILGDELNVKAVTFHTDDAGLVTLSATANFRALGPRVGKKMNEVAAAIAALPEEIIARIENGAHHDLGPVVIGRDDIQVRRTEEPGLALKSDGFMTVALDTRLTEALSSEGFAREFVHLVQNERKAIGLQLTDRIKLTLWAPEASKALAEAMEAHHDYICRETLATHFVVSAQAPAGTKLGVNGLECVLRIEKAS